MSLLRRTALLLAVLLGCFPAAWAEEAPRIPVGGDPQDAAGLRAIAADVRTTLEVVRQEPEPDKALLDALVAEIEALERAAGLLDAIEAAPAASQAASQRLAKAKEALQAAQTDSAKEIAVDDVDQEAIETYEAQARQRAVEAKAAADAAATLATQVATRTQEIEQAPARMAQLETRATELQAALAAAPEDDVGTRKLLDHQLRANEVRRGMGVLDQTHHATLLDLDTARRDAARIEAETAATRQRTADAWLARARERYEKRLAEEAARKEEETRRKLREAELAASPAVQAVKRLEAVLGRMEVEHAHERRQLSELKARLSEASVLARIGAARLESARTLFPPGVALETWQQEAMADHRRQIDRDEQLLAKLRDGPFANTAVVRAQVLTERGRLDVYQQRLAAAQDRTDAQGEADRASRVEEELSYAQGEDAKLWLQARLDFIRGQEELRPDEVERLRVRWQEITTRLKDVLQARAEDLRQTESVVGELTDTLSAIEQSLSDRRAHLGRIAFWMRSDPLTSRRYLAAVLADVETLGVEIVAAQARLAGLPQRVTAAPAAGARLGVLFAFVLLALGLGRVVGRRIRSLDLVTRPVRGLDALQRIARGALGALRAVLTPALLLAAALWLRAEAPGEGLATVAVACAVAWLFFVLGRAVGTTFYAPDGAGDNLAGCSDRTARSARRAARAAFGVTGVWLGAALLLDLAGVTHLRQVASFAWGVGAVVLGTWLLFRRDVLLSVVPEEAGGALATTVRSVLQVAWPLAVLLWAANLLLNAAGYRTASSYFAQRALLLMGALVAIGMVHALLRAWIVRHAPPAPEEPAADAYDPLLARRQLGSRLLGQLLTLAAIAAVVLAASLTFQIGSEDWRALARWSLTGETPGTGLTLGRIFKAVLLFVGTVVIARHVRDLTRIVLRTRGRVEQGTRYAVRTVLFYVVLVVGTVAALAALGLDMTQFGWFLTAAGVGIGFGLQEILSNLISGLILFFERPVQVGDVVTIGTVEGDVQQINIRSTVVRTRDGVSIILPNKRLITDEVINWSHGQKRTRLQIEVGVAYGSDISRVREVLMRCALDEALVLRRPAPEVEFHAFGDSQLTFILYAWLASPDITLRRRVRSNLNTAIDKAFAENGVTIPFPQRDVHIKGALRPDA